MVRVRPGGGGVRVRAGGGEIEIERLILFNSCLQWSQGSTEKLQNFTKTFKKKLHTNKQIISELKELIFQGSEQRQLAIICSHYCIT